jgi:glycosyltransferase involved in cell wall biosynthesis
MPKVSIIIPYNKDRGFFKEAFMSAENQTFGDFEIIVQHGANESLGKNINDGILRSSGEWVKILSEDDILPDNSIELLYAKAMEGFDWIVGDAENFGDLKDGWEYAAYWTAINPTLAGMLKSNQIHGGTTLYRRDILFKTGGYDESLWTGEEYDLHLNLLANGYKVGVVNKVVYKYRLHDHNKSMDMSPKASQFRREYITDKIKSRYYKYV